MNNLKAFLYILMRDEIVPGKIERIMKDHVRHIDGKDVVYSNKYLAEYAEELANEIYKDPNKEPCGHPIVYDYGTFGICKRCDEKVGSVK